VDPSPTTSPHRRRPSRRGEGAALRDEIIEAATALLSESNDATAVSLRAIARRVGIATTSIYLHFDDLAQLLEAVSVARFAEFAAYLTDVRDRAGPDPIDRISSTLCAYVHYAQANPGAYAVMFSVDRGPEAQAQPIGLNSFRVLADEVAAALDAPLDDPQANLLAVSLWTFCDGLVHLRASRPHFPWPDLEHQIDYTTRRLLNTAATDLPPGGRRQQPTEAEQAAPATQH
jgi:AcrR family transcriptional regulator